MHSHSSEPSLWVSRFAHLVRASGSVLDVACGSGRHARFFANRGCQVTAVDRDAALVAGLSGVERVVPVTSDLENAPWPFAEQQFDAIVVVNYLHRPLWRHLTGALASDGVLLYETFAVGNEAFGKPSSPRFLLTPAELVDVFAPVLTIVAFEQGEVALGERHAVVQRVAAVGPGRTWPPCLQDAT
ncbi:MAG: class I SAM-dependent methyltransferase [Pseudomonadota bacterium]|nr:class I SAM-dependent methyltransferase [Pseudomonadota bacterium]